MVYITHLTKSDFDFSDAQKYGELEVVYSEQPALLNHYAHRVKQLIINFNPAKDFLLCVGDPIVIGFVMSQIAVKLFLNVDQKGTINCLKWDKLNKTYLPLKLELI